jgi:autotransporter-associated beta strand protein
MKKFIAALIGSGLIFLLSVIARAGSAQWDLNPGSGDWNTATNWTPMTVPNSFDIATFDLSETTAVSLSADTEVDSIVFNSGASAYTITASPGLTLTISGTGITNSSGTTQNFVTAVNEAGGLGAIVFTNSATAGSMTAFTNNGSAVSGHADGGFTEFFDTSTAGSATITNNGSAVSGAAGGFTLFFDTSSAGNGTFTNNGAGFSGANVGGFTGFVDMSTAANGIFINNGGTVSGAEGGFTVFVNSSTAGGGTFINNGGTVSGAIGGATEIARTSTAGSATLIANGGTGGGDGGTINFYEDSTGGTARVEVFDNGNLDISRHNAGSVTIGSIEGTGNVFLGANDLTVGSNNLSTTFSGVIQDDGAGGGTGGSLTKIGSGTLDLTGANTYTGGTTVSSGTLLVNNSIGSGTGSGAVQVNAGTLGGTGTIAGAVTVGTGSGAGAFLSPGTSPGTLTIQSSLTLNSDATYQFELDSSTAAADKIVANGVTINGANFSFSDLGHGKFSIGATLIIIDNTSTSPISGVFNNLSDGSTFSSNGSTFLVSYEGGTGNDLSLTSVAASVPEPMTWALLIFGAVPLTYLSRRCRG